MNFIFSESPILSFMIDVTIKSSCLILLIALACWILRRVSSASFTSTIWSATIVGVVGMPILVWSLPSLPLLPQFSQLNPPATALRMETLTRTNSNLPNPSGILPEKPSKPTDSAVAALPIDNTTSHLEIPLFSHDSQSKRPSQTFNVIVLIWTMGMLIGFARMVRSYVRILLFSSSQSRLVKPESKLVKLVKAESRTLGIQPPQIRLGEVGTMPAVWGIFNQNLLLPADAETWPEHELKQVVIHELAHLKRRDPAMLLHARLAATIYWFNPVVWFAVNEMSREREAACDDFVLSTGAKASDYAELLLKMATQSNESLIAGYLSLAMARPLKVETRIDRILDVKRRRNQARLQIVVAIFIAALIASSAFAAVAPIEQKQDQQNETASNKTKIKEPASTRKPADQENEKEKNGQVELAAESKVLLSAQNRVSSELSRAAGYVEALQTGAGTWDQLSSKGDTTALATLALIRAGAAANAKKRKRAVEALAKLTFDTTYTVSLQTIALCESDSLSHAKVIRANVDWLCKAQQKTGPVKGGWTYVLPTEKHTSADGSNSRFAIWSLTIAKKYGFKIPDENFDLAAAYWLDSQHKNGGWGYTTGAAESSVTMTLSGIASLSQLKPALADKAGLHAKLDRAVARAWKFKDIEAKVFAQKKFNMYAWQIYSLASQVTDKTIKDLDQTQISSPQKIEATFTKARLQSGVSGSFGLGWTLIETSLAIIALSPEEVIGVTQLPAEEKSRYLLDFKGLGR